MFRRVRSGFTLIELLIVVAIIAILAAIAVPNFLEAKNRAKVSRGKADMRSLATAVEAYAVDNNTYPPVHPSPTSRLKYCYFLFFLPGYRSSAVYPVQPFLSTPIAYISEYPLQPFQPRGVTNQENSGYRDNSSFYFVNFKAASQDDPFLDANDLYEPGTKIPYVKSPSPINVIGGGDAGIKQSVEWLIFGLGPSGVQDIQDTEDNYYNNQSMANVLMCFHSTGRFDGWKKGHWKAYDPTNGSMSLGFIYRFQGGGPD